MDKVQKIREELVRLKKETSIGLSEHENGIEQGRMEIIDALSIFLDSLQEEPVSSIWHDASEKSNKAEDVVVINPSDNTGEILTGCIKVYQGHIWAYTSVLLNLDNSCKISKNLQEEPVSEELEKAEKEWLTPQLDKSYANYGEAKMMELTHFDGYAMLDAIEFGAKWQKEKDESIIEDLGNYINELSKQFPEVSFAKLSRIAVRVAKWQKQQDQSTIELAEDHAYFAGRTKTIDEINEALLSEVLPCFMHGGEADEVVAKLDEVLNQKK